MQLHQLKPIHKIKKKEKKGRGGKKGSYSGKGTKGQKSRAGRKFQPIIREIIKKYPKIKGYRRGVGKKAEAVINLSLLAKRFKDGEIISPQSLLKNGIIHKINNRLPVVKILGKGEIKRKLIIKNCQISKNAKNKIQKNGGKTE